VRHREVQLFDLCCSQFVEQHREQAGIRTAFFVEHWQMRRAGQQLAEQWRHRYGAAALREIGSELRIDEGAIALQRAAHLDGMQGATRDPDRTARWNDPKATFDLTAERTALHEYDLPLAMPMRLQFEPAEIFRDEAIGDHRPWNVIGFDPVRFVAQFGEDRHGALPLCLAETDNNMAELRDDAIRGGLYW